MEPIGAASGVLGVAEVGFSLAATLYKYASSVKSAEKELKAIAKDVELTSKVLKQTHHQIQRDQNVKLCTSEALDLTSDVLSGCQDAFREVDEALKGSIKTDANGKPSVTIGARMKWPLKSGKLDVLRANLEKLKTTLLLMLSVLAYGRKVMDSRTLPNETKADLSLDKLQIQNLVEARDEATRRYEEMSAAFAKIEARLMVNANILPPLPPPPPSTSSASTYGAVSSSVASTQASDFMEGSASQPRDLQSTGTFSTSVNARVSDCLDLCTSAVLRLANTIDEATHRWHSVQILEHHTVTESLKAAVEAVAYLSDEGKACSGTASLVPMRKPPPVPESTSTLQKSNSLTKRRGRRLEFPDALARPRSRSSSPFTTSKGGGQMFKIPDKPETSEREGANDGEAAAMQEDSDDSDDGLFAIPIRSSQQQASSGRTPSSSKAQEILSITDDSNIRSPNRAELNLTRFGKSKSNVRFESPLENRGSEASDGTDGEIPSLAASRYSPDSLEGARISRSSRTFSNDTWANRPPPELIVEYLDEFFPRPDLDQRVTEEGAKNADSSLVSTDKSTLKAGQLGNEGEIYGAGIKHAKPEHGTPLTSHIETTTEEIFTSQDNQLTFKWTRGRLIGRNALGRVYLGINTTTTELLTINQVEINSPSTDRAKLREMVNTLENEIRTLKDLGHANIVQYLGCESEEYSASIFQEYVSGGSVGSCLRKHGKLEESVVSSIARQTLSGLSYLHAKGILHRDLKADNILLDLEGRCKIADFGISKRSAEFFNNDTVGSIFWMAPEVIQAQSSPSGANYSTKADIWSLGCVVLEMFAGRRPWDKEEAIGAIYRLGSLNQAPPIPDDVSSAIGPASLAFMFDCFTLDPGERPTAEALLLAPLCMLYPNFVFHDTALYASVRDAKHVKRNEVVDDDDEDTLKPERQSSLTPVEPLDPTNGESTNAYSRIERQQQIYLERRGMRRGLALSLQDYHDFDSRSDHPAEQEPERDVVDELLQKWTTVVV